MKKIFGLLVCIFVLGLCLPSFQAAPPDQLDQSSPLGWRQWICGFCCTGHISAQAFRPTLSTLTRVELGFWKQVNVTGNFTVSIRKTLNGDDLTAKTLSLDEVPWMNYGDWVSVDFEDITVTPNQRYFIVVHYDSDDNLHWIITYYTPYHRGMPWFRGNFPFWTPLDLTSCKLPDMSFRTYGF
jgi:hypothetical protein